MMIIDAGVHVWPPEAPDRPWMPGRKAHLPEPLTHEKFSAMMKEAGVEHAILVPPSWEGDRRRGQAVCRRQPREIYFGCGAGRRHLGAGARGPVSSDHRNVGRGCRG